MSSQASKILWTIAAIVAAVVIIFAAVFGPKMYRRGKAVVGPIMDLASSEDALAALDRELPFEAPAEMFVDAGRLDVFLSVREALVPHYEGWQVTRARVEQSGEESWEGAADVLGEVQVVFAAQEEILRIHAMSPAEFKWLEATVYDDWLQAVESVQTGESPIVNRLLIESTEADLAYLAEVETAHGSSRALRLLRERLTNRRDRLASPEMITIEGIPEANSELFWAHRERIWSLRLDVHEELHSRLRDDQGNINVSITAD